MKPTIVIAITAVTLLIAACQTTRTAFQEPANDDYRGMSLTWTSGYKSHLFVRVFGQNGHMAFCGLILSESPPGEHAVEETYFGVNKLYVDGEPVGTGDFLPVYGADEDGPFRAGCVETSVAWNDSLATGNITMDGSRRIVVKY
jgi:hypothetical protein